MSKSYGLNRFSEKGAQYDVEFSVYKDVASIYLNTSGAGLHKRGYRDLVGIAPIKETLASALLLMSDFYYKRPFADPFCGSGTIPIETAMIMTKRAPGMNRSFAAEAYDFLPHDIWKDAREEARAAIDDSVSFEAWGSDVDREVLGFAEENAKRAGVSDRIRFFHQDARRVQKPEGRRGTIICNPPYGERMMTRQQVEALYKDMGRAFDAMSPWQVYILSSCEGFERLYGRRADKIRKLFNGMIPCNLYQYFRPKN